MPKSQNPKFMYTTSLMDLMVEFHNINVDGSFPRRIHQGMRVQIQFGRLIGKVQARTRCDWFIEEVRRDRSYGLEENHVWCEVIYMIYGVLAVWRLAGQWECIEGSKSLDNGYLESKHWPSHLSEHELVQTRTQKYSLSFWQTVLNR